MSPVDFLSPTWWLSVVVMSVVLNLVSAYLKPGVDSLLGSLSSVWRARVQTNRTRREALIQQYREDPMLINLLGTSSVWTLVLATFLLLMSFILLALTIVPDEIYSEHAL